MRTANPLVTVMMSAYNHEKYVGKAIESVLNQTYQDFKFIVAEDFSSDSTREVIMRYENEIDEIHLFDTNSGHGRNRELLPFIDTKYVALINSDDYWEIDKLEKQVEYLENHPECAVCFTMVRNIDDEGNEVPGYVFDATNKSKDDWVRYFIENGNCLCNPSMLARSDIYLGIRDNRNHRRFHQLPDFYIWIDTVMKHEIHIISEQLVNFRWRNDGKNVSAPTKINQIRTVYETAMIWREVMNEMSADDFKRIFAEYLIDPAACEEEEIKCEKFLTMASIDNTGVQQAAIDYFLQISEDNAVANVMLNKYGFTHRMYCDLTQNVGLIGLMNKIYSQLDELLAERNSIVVAYNELVKQMQGKE